MTLCTGTDRHWQTMSTQIRLFLHYWSFCLRPQGHAYSQYLCYNVLIEDKMTKSCDYVFLFDHKMTGIFSIALLLLGFEINANNWAVTWQSQQCDCAPSEDSDQPGHPPSLTRIFAVRMRRAWVLIYPLSAQRILWSDWADAGRGVTLSLTTHWVHREDSDQTGQMLGAESLCLFCHVTAHFR